MNHPYPLDATERAAILATFDRLDRASVQNYAPLGTPLMLGAVALYWAGSGPLTRLAVAPDGPVRWLLPLAALSLGLAGLPLLLFGGAWAGLRPLRLAQDAVTILTTPGHDPETLLRAAVTLIDNGHYSGGPWTVATFAPATVRQALGAQIAFVEAVEAVLRAERGAWPVFTETSPQP